MKSEPASARSKRASTSRVACPSCSQTDCESVRVVFGRVTLICTNCAHTWTIAERRAVMRPSDASKVY